MQPTQKEAGLLKDLKDQEQLCVDKYRRHAASANDPQLKNLFEQLAQVEQQHLDAIAQMAQGTVCKPADSATVPGTFTAAYSSADSPQKQNDCYLCSDVLTMEKHASHLYDTCVFEFRDADARSVLNDIQAQAGWLTVGVVVLVVLCGLALCLMTYAAMAIGQSFKKNKGLMSVVFFFVLWIGTRIVLTLIFGAFYGPASSAVNTMTVLQALWTVLGCACVGALAFCVGFFFLTHGMLRKHLNLQ